MSFFYIYQITFVALNAVMSGVTPLKWSLQGDFISHNTAWRGPGDTAGLKRLFPEMQKAADKAISSNVFFWTCTCSAVQCSGTAL